MKTINGKYHCSIELQSDRIVVKVTAVQMTLTENGVVNRNPNVTKCGSIDAAKAFCVMHLTALMDELDAIANILEGQPDQLIPVFIFGYLRHVGLNTAQQEVLMDDTRVPTEQNGMARGAMCIESIRDVYFFITEAITAIQEWKPSPQISLPGSSATYYQNVTTNSTATVNAF